MKEIIVFTFVKVVEKSIGGSGPDMKRKVTFEIEYDDEGEFLDEIIGISMHEAREMAAKFLLNHDRTRIMQEILESNELTSNQKLAMLLVLYGDEMMSTMWDVLDDLYDAVIMGTYKLYEQKKEETKEPIKNKDYWICPVCRKKNPYPSLLVFARPLKMVFHCRNCHYYYVEVLKENLGVDKL